MALDSCKYCDQPAYKTNGKAETICYNRAFTGSCEKPNLEIRIADKVGRNEPCPCGSGLKYKKCCINEA